MPIADTDTSNANIIAILALIVMAVLMWQQNGLIKKQNDILAKENEMSSPSLKLSRLHSYWPLVATFILSFLGWGAVLYYRGDRRDSVSILAGILLLVLLALAWPLITVLR